MVKKNHKLPVLLAAIILLLVQPVWSQIGYQFGQNKVRYKNFDWAIFRTEHFDVHYYPEEEQAAKDAARMAERGYSYLSKVLNHQIKKRVPLIIYASLNDFSQTNVIHGLLNQGTRGVTESLKGRVILPITGSYREFNHVLVHELVHAFQFDLLLAGQIKKIRFNPPLWFVEGMAEYLSIGMDNTTRMWVRDGLIYDKLMTIDQLNSAFDIRVYRLGESVWHFIGENYGKEKVGDVFKWGIRTGSLEQAFQKTLNLTTKELTQAWHKFARNLVIPSDSTLKAPEQIAEKLTRKETFYHRMNIAPSVSPDGKMLAFVSNKNLNEEIMLLSEDDKGEFKKERLIKGGTSKQFETLRFFDTAIGWSKDGQRVAFVSRSGKDDAIYIVNPHTKKILSSFIFDTLNGLQSPTFSPEGDKLSFVGIYGGISDLYILNLHTEKLTRLTDDQFTVLHPQWSPNGKAIAFVTDRGPGTDIDKLLFGDYDIALYYLNNNDIELITELPGNTTNPQWSPDGGEIAFISEHHGIRNIYKLNLASKNIVAITSLRNGISGITESTPALSWSADGSVMVFSVFQKSSWQLYRLKLDTPPSLALPIADAAIINPVRPISDSSSTDLRGAGSVVNSSTTGDINSDSLWLPALTDQSSLYGQYQLGEEDSIESRNYSKKLTLDAVSLGGGFNTFFGFAGGAQFLFGDMFGNNNLSISTELQFSDPRFSDAAVTYFNQSKRINYGIQAFQQSYSYVNGASFNSLGLIRNTFRGFNAIAAYPFSRFARIELSTGITWVDQDFVVETFNFNGVDRETSNIGTFNFMQFGGALVLDNTTYGFLGPVGGSRSRFSVETNINDFQFTNYIADYRRYLKINSRSVFAFRFLGGTSVGADRQIFRIGGPFTYRGADFNELLGPNFFVTNFEYRFPAFPFLPPNADFISGAAFIDAAAAWGTNVPGIISKKFQPFTSSSGDGLRLKDLNVAPGVGARLNLGYFLLKFDVAWPTDLQSFDQAVTLFSIGTFF